jgi:hypothetical protein
MYNPDTFVFAVQFTKEDMEKFVIGPGELHHKISLALEKIDPVFKNKIKSNSFWVPQEKVREIS